MKAPVDRLRAALADRYAIQEEIGAGGMATVYLAEDRKHHRRVALKVLRPELAAILGGDRFLKEIEVTANLQHPNILPLYDSGAADSFLYYVMPFVEGESLRDKLARERQLSVEETVEIAKSVAAALQYAHERDIVHRDIKPENILVQSGQALVADFGIALAIRQAGGTRLTETGLSLGTPHYMSPEQAMGDRELDARSDVYSLGCVVYEMLVGEPPHVGGSVQAIIGRILSHEPEPISNHRHSVPAHVDAAVRKALEKTPADRFATAAQLSEALTNPAFTLPTASGAVPGTAGEPRPWNRVAIMGWSAAAALAVLLIWGFTRPEPPAPVSRYSVVLPEKLWAGVTTTSRLTITPDGARLVYVGVGVDGQRQLLVRARNQLHATPLPGTDGAQSPFISSDGESVGYLIGSSVARIASLTGTPPITRLDSGIAGRGGAWGKDGNLYLTTPNGLSRFPADGGSGELVTTRDTTECAHAWPDVLPNNRGVVFTTMGRPCSDMSQYRIAVADFETGQHRALVAGVRARYAASGHLLVVTADGTLLAAPFDEDRLEMGTATPIADGVAVRVSGTVDLDVSETGRLVYVSGPSLGTGESGEAVWVDRGGVVTPVDPNWRFETIGNAGWAISPDGTRLAVKINTEAGQDIYVKHLDTGPLSRLTFDPAEDVRPRWTPDGRSVSFVSPRAGQSDLYTRRADGTGVAELLLHMELPIWEAVWSADGEWLLVRTGGVAGLTGGRDIWGMRLGVDTVPVPILTSDFDERAIALSPDSRWIAYESDETGRDEVYVRPFPDPEGGKWQVSSNGGRAPLWAHSGRELFYMTPERELVAARIVPGPDFVWTTEPLFTIGPEYTGSENYTWFDVAPDDQRFLMVRLPSDVGQQDELIVVENFFEELKAKVGT